MEQLGPVEGLEQLSRAGWEAGKEKSKRRKSVRLLQRLDPRKGDAGSKKWKVAAVVLAHIPREGIWN